MSKKRRIETSSDLVDAFEDLMIQMIMDDLDEADAILREAGYDPKELGQSMKEFAQQVSANSPMDWRNKSGELDREKQKLTDAQRLFEGKSRQEIESRVRQLWQGLAKTSSPAMAAYRNLVEDSDPTQLSDQELKALLTHLEYLSSHPDMRDNASE